MNIELFLEGTRRTIQNMADFAVANPAQLARAFRQWFVEDLKAAIVGVVESMLVFIVAGQSFELGNYTVDTLVRAIDAWDGFIEHYSDLVSGN